MNNCPLPQGASLNTGFPTPCLRSSMLRTCERGSSAGTTNEPLSSPSGKRIWSCSAKALHNGINCFPVSWSSSPVSWSSSDLAWRTKIVVLEEQQKLPTQRGYHHFYTEPRIPGTRPPFQKRARPNGTCFAVNSDWPVMCWNV